MEYPWEDIEIIEIPVWKCATIIISEVSDNCTLHIIECTRNEPEVCMNEFFIHRVMKRVNGEVYEEQVFGPWHSHELKNFMIAMRKVHEKYEMINFNR